MTNPTYLFDVLRHAQASARRLVIDGARWLVYELPPFQFDRRASPALVFDSESGVRRLQEFPPNWRSLSDDELVALTRDN